MVVPALLLSLLFTLTLLLLPRPAAAEVEGSVGVTDNYVIRGISRSNDKPALAGGVVIGGGSGAYAGTRANTIETRDAEDGFAVDLFGGYAWNTDNFRYDIGMTYLLVADETFAEEGLGEVYMNVDFSQFRAGMAYSLQNEQEGGRLFEDGNLYTFVGYTLPVTRAMSLGLTTGYTLVEDPQTSPAEDDYGHVQLDLNYANFVISVSRADKNSGDDDTKVSLSWSREFSF